MSATRTVGTALLAAGYPVAVVSAFRLRAGFRHRRGRPVAVFAGATAAVVAGWALRGRWAPSAVNLGALAALGVAWWATGRRAGRS